MSARRRRVWPSWRNTADLGMVKSKLRKKSARISIKLKSKEQQIKKQNTFDLKFNRAKHAVLGKQTIGAIGKPTASKKKALEHREKTLLKEYKAFGKTNKIVDNRIGEYDFTLTEEQKAYKRCAEERKISGTKVNKYDLNEEEGEVTLTHGGRALYQVEKYDKTMVSDDEDDDFGAEMVEKVHFGGGNQATTNFSKKDLITELIARSKQTKMEKQNIKDEQEAITETLYEKLKRLMKRGALDKGVGGRKTKETATVEKDNYDTLLDTLRTSEDPRVKAGYRRKSEEERERLAKLESDRLLRHNTHANESTHFSVDDDAPRPKKKQSVIMELKYDSEGRAVTSHTVEKASIMGIGPEDDETTSEEDGDEDDERVREEMEEGLDEMFDMESEDEGEGESAEKERQEELEKKRRGTKNIKDPIAPETVVSQKSQQFDRSGDPTSNASPRDDNITKVIGNNCLPKAIAVGIAYLNRERDFPKWKALSRSMKRQNKAARELLYRLGLPPKESYDLKDVKEMQERLTDYQLIVFDGAKHPLFRGPFAGDGKVIGLRLKTSHYDHIKRIEKVWRGGTQSDDFP